MSEQYGGPWNSPTPQGGAAPQGYPVEQGYPAQQRYPAQQGYPGAPGHPTQPGYPDTQNHVPQPGGYPGSPPLRNDYATWGKRVLAYVIDFLPGLIGASLFYIGYGIAIFASLDTGNPTPDLGAGAGWMMAGGVIALIGLAWTIFNRWITAGRTGQSLGKRITKIALIGEETNAPIGPLNAFLRDLVHTLDGFAYVGYLWPLWDERKQTFSDKIMKTAVIKTPQNPELTPPS